MHYKYYNNYHIYCHDFAESDEIVFTIALCGLSKAAVENPVDLQAVNVAISHFRDYGRPLRDQVYKSVEGAWGRCGRTDPPLAMRFVNDQVDEVPDQRAARVRRQKLWNSIMSELRFPDRIDVDEGDEPSLPLALPGRSELRQLIRQTIGPALRDNLMRALEKEILTPDVVERPCSRGNKKLISPIWRPNWIDFGAPSILTTSNRETICSYL